MTSLDLEAAREILEGRHGFQYFSQLRLSLIKELLEPNVTGLGQILLLTGPSGAGISTLLKALSEHPEFYGVNVPTSVLDYEYRMTNHIIRAYGFFTQLGRGKGVPSVLKEYVQLTGKGKIILDDIDCLSSRSFESIVEELQWFQGAQVGFNLIISSRNPQLLRIISKKLKGIRLISLERNLPEPVCIELVNNFWAWCNASYCLKFQTPKILVEICRGLSFDLDYVMSAIECIYVYQACCGMEAGHHHIISLEEARFEVESLIYA
ncbi:hypothetical protein ABI582_19210 [Pseudomonas sp. SAS7]|uniref:hypothetical protein n=1 Tax=Pseudomonas sp. SAS7 TaxID=3156487 RepID=UPI003F94935A